MRKGSDVPSLGEGRDADGAPLASFEAMSDLEESDADRDSKVTSPEMEYDVFDNPPVVEEGESLDANSSSTPPHRPASPSRSRSPNRPPSPARPPSPRAASPARPDRPPSPAMSKTPARPPSPSRSKSPARPPSPSRSKSPARPPSPYHARSPNLGIPGANFPGAPDSTVESDDKKTARSAPARPPAPGPNKLEVAESSLISTFDQEESELVAIHGEEGGGGGEIHKEESTMGVVRERPHSTTPIAVATLDDYKDLVDPAKQEAVDDVEKIKITLPTSQFNPSKAKGSQISKVDTAEAWMDFEQPYSLENEEDGSMSDSSGKAAPKHPSPPPVEAVSHVVVESNKRSWTTFGDDEGGNEEEELPPPPVSHSAPPARPAPPSRPSAPPSRPSAPPSKKPVYLKPGKSYLDVIALWIYLNVYCFK